MASRVYTWKSNKRCLRNEFTTLQSSSRTYTSASLECNGLCRHLLHIQMLPKQRRKCTRFPDQTQKARNSSFASRPMLTKRGAKVPYKITRQAPWASASASAFSHTHLDSTSSLRPGWTHRRSRDRDYACAGPFRAVSKRPLAAPDCCLVRYPSRWTSRRTRSRKRSRQSRGVCGIYSRLGQRGLVTLSLSFHFVTRHIVGSHP
jgi:hypothetical protein